MGPKFSPHDAVATTGAARAPVGAIGLSLALIVTAIERKRVAVIATFGALRDTIAAGGRGAGAGTSLALVPNLQPASLVATIIGRDAPVVVALAGIDGAVAANVDPDARLSLKRLFELVVSDASR